MPGSGKSTIAKKLSEQMNYKYIDSDEYIELKYNLKISEIFEKFGEEKFREFEHSALKDILKKDNFILSSGGGMPCFKNNIDIMNEIGKTVYLKVSVETLYNRTIKETKKRPLLKNKSSNEIKNYIKLTLTERENEYKKAKYIINAEQSIRDILHLFKKLF